MLSTLDLMSGFYQIAMDPESSDLTTFVCLAGKLKFKRMPFGLRNAPSIFQQTMERVLKSVREVSGVYIDDIVVFSRNWEAHLADLRRVLVCLREAGLVVTLRKCTFGKSRLRYLGHLGGCGKVSVPKERVEAFRNYGMPRTKKGLCSFLGAISYYRKFIPRFSERSARLSPSTSLAAPRQVVWSEEMGDAFIE